MTGFVYGPQTVLVAPAGTPLPETLEQALDPETWQLVSPTCPDALPEDE